VSLFMCSFFLRSSSSSNMFYLLRVLGVLHQGQSHYALWVQLLKYYHRAISTVLYVGKAIASVRLVHASSYSDTSSPVCGSLTDMISFLHLWTWLFDSGTF
jgi:hypothetical protein